MVDLGNQQFYDLPGEETSAPKKGPDKKTLMIIVGSVIAVVVIAAVVVFIVNTVRQNRVTREVEVQVVDRLNGMIASDVADCQGDEACENRVRKTAAVELGEVVACEGITGEAYNDCVSLMALETADPKLCKDLQSDAQTVCENIAYQEMAYNDLDLSACAKIDDEQKSSYCTENVTIKIVNTGMCQFYGLEQQLCDREVSFNAEISRILDTGNPAECDMFSDENEKAECIDALYSSDGDKDGLLAAFESENGTRDDNPDSDGDGLKDGDEVNIYGTSPTNPDTDGDGFSDGDEVEAGYNPLS